MFDKLIGACKRLKISQALASETSGDILQLVPDGTTAKDLENFLSVADDTLDHVTILRAAYATIVKISKDIRGQDSNDEDEFLNTLNEIANRMSSMILPVCSSTSLEEITDYSIPQYQGSLGITALEKLTKLPAKAPLRLQPSALLCLVAFTDTVDPWTTTASSALARDLLETQLENLGQSRTPSFITDEILTRFLRPLFSKSRPAAVTASGRKAEYVEPSRYDTVSQETPETKPWKYTHRYAVAIFAWAVKNANTPLLQAHWPLFTPVLLTLLDEPQHTALKIRALGIFRNFWARCPPGLMQDTGLASVFEDAVFPAVLYLPSLTPEDESLEILGAAYPALIEMAGLSYPGPTGPELQGENPQVQGAKRKLLDKIIREGIMVGYHHAKEHVKLVSLLCEMLACIVNGMGILAVKHLKDFIPMVSEIMTDPFGTKHPPTLVVATKLLQAILRTCWPRIPQYCNEIIKTLMLCWLNIEDEESFSDESPVATDLRSGLIETASMLTAVMKAAKVDFSERINPLVEKEPQLRKLFVEIDSA
ncbi:hypothetical protein F5Y04DRAFT_98197 [Hypomontagnella monticulosa]|nr:hypothetical protein F5Y04DRAFT_98197 [Hypomontagnella monticulosa]